MPEKKKSAAEPVQEMTTEQASETSALGATVVDAAREMPHLDFITALILMIVSVTTIITSIGYWQKQRVLFYESTGFMPTIIGSVLLVMAVLLLIQSLRASSARENIARLITGARQTLSSPSFYKRVVGLAIFALYVYVLLGTLPFWLASFITLAIVLVFNHFDGKIRTVLTMLLIAALAVAAIVGLFQYAFSVPMP